MAFVYRQQRNYQQKIRNANVGPGSYHFQLQPRQNKIPKAYVPFGSMQPKIKEIKYPSNITPGPGTYNIQPPQNGQKIVVSSQTEDIKILEISRPHPVFKSGTQRFNLNKQEQLQNPGPGAYNIVKNDYQQRQKIYSQNISAKPKIIQHLININKYQSIPSIPSNIHAFGYNENQKNQLELNEPPIDVFKGQKQDKVGPGQYNVNPQMRVRGASWSQAKQKRFQQTKTNLVVGPGTYQAKTVQPLYSYKPTGQFASKTVRGMDQRKGALTNKMIQQKVSKQIDPVQSRIFSQKGAASTHIGDDQSDEQYQYIEDTTPGPGSYLEVYEPHKYQPKIVKTKTNFGLSKRFDDKVQNPKLGPGIYNSKQPNFKKQSRKPNGPPPPADIQRFPGLVNKKKIQLPPPGAYEPRNTMEDKLIYKIQRGYRGQFGSTQGRFKQPQEQQKPGPGQYDINYLNSEQQVSAIFKSKTGVRPHIKSLYPAPGAYNLNHLDIATRVIKQQEDDPDLIIKKPGFGVGQQRFKQLPKRDDDFEDDDIIKQIQQKNRQQKKRKMLKNSSCFKSKDPRFKDQRKQHPGPGAYYDGQEDYWNKRTYNILFADI